MPSPSLTIRIYNFTGQQSCHVAALCYNCRSFETGDHKEGDITKGGNLDGRSDVQHSGDVG